jgi:GAF domain-containing protein
MGAEKARRGALFIHLTIKERFHRPSRSTFNVILDIVAENSYICRQKNRPVMSTKEDSYKLLTSQIQSLMEGEEDLVARMANAAAMIHDTFRFWWTGFYRVQGEQLVLGPFQGPMACTRIGFGRGVCGSAWQQQRTLVVPDVEQFPGHIACSSRSKSEIVVPVLRDGTVIAVLDIDSENLATFDETDQRYLEQIAEIIAR